MYRSITRACSRGGQKVACSLITAYRYTISPLLGNCCRFYPSCSIYSKEAIEQHGLFKGLGYTIWRLLRCHPLHPGGIDPVPEKKINNEH